MQTSVRRTRLVLALATAFWTSAGLARAADPEFKEKGEINKKVDSKESVWSYFSAGFLVNYFPKDLIAEAQIREGTVRARKRINAVVGVGLQAFYPIGRWEFFRSDDSGATWAKYSDHGIGPYVGASLSSEEVIDSFAIGVAYSHRREDAGVRIGVGCALDPDAQYLAKDYALDAVAPAGSEGVEYEQKPAFGLQVMITFTPGW
jgi:hypothetical protein